MKRITIYEAFDGKSFNTEKECMDYEMSQKVLDSANALKEFCVSCDNCKDCPFYSIIDDCKLFHLPYTWKLD